MPFALLIQASWGLKTDELLYMAVFKIYHSHYLDFGYVGYDT